MRARSRSGTRLRAPTTRGPIIIRRQLTEGAVRASDKRAQFVGLDAYEAAGGIVMRDLFEDDDGGWLQDPALLDRLVAEKLAPRPRRCAAKAGNGLRPRPIFLMATPPACAGSPARRRRSPRRSKQVRDALRAEFDSLQETYASADELPDEVDARLGEIETLLEAFDERPAIYDPAEIARAGVFVSIDADGDLRIERGYVRREDEAACVPSLIGEIRRRRRSPRRAAAR